jgi:hypothetical protein
VAAFAGVVAVAAAGVAEDVAGSFDPDSAAALSFFSRAFVSPARESLR